MNESSLPVLSLLETRVLGVLAEKQHTVPDTYPLTLNALVAGCNQKSSRNPIMNVSQIEVQEAIDNLKYMSFVIETSGGRTARFAHNIERVLKIPVQSVALVTMLMLRGPQTAGELRINSERLHKFADISSVEAFLDELAERAQGSLVIKLPRQSGSRENRWAHLLAGKPEINEHEHAPVMQTYEHTECAVSEQDFAALKSNVVRLEAEMVALRKIVEELSSQPASPQNGN
ncbi:MAG TPA: YceH family protein [Nitrosomonas nitrosa]|nr:YceH family protein [Nitrosomonas nitrosa]